MKMATNSQNYFEYNKGVSHTFTLIGGNFEMMTFSDDDLQPKLGGDVFKSVENIPDDILEEFELTGNNDNQNGINILDLIGGEHVDSDDIITNDDIGSLLGGCDCDYKDDSEIDVLGAGPSFENKSIGVLLGAEYSSDDIESSDTSDEENIELVDTKNDFKIDDLLKEESDESSSDYEDDLRVLGGFRGFGKVF